MGAGVVGIVGEICKKLWQREREREKLHSVEAYKERFFKRRLIKVQSRQYSFWLAPFISENLFAPSCANPLFSAAYTVCSLPLLFSPLVSLSQLFPDCDIFTNSPRWRRNLLSVPERQVRPIREVDGGTTTTTRRGSQVPVLNLLKTTSNFNFTSSRQARGTIVYSRFYTSGNKFIKTRFALKIHLFKKEMIPNLSYNKYKHKIISNLYQRQMARAFLLNAPSNCKVTVRRVW